MRRGQRRPRNEVEQVQYKYDKLRGKRKRSLSQRLRDTYAMTKEAGHQRLLFAWRDRTTEKLGDTPAGVALRHFHASIAGVYLHPAAAMKVKLTGGLKGVPDLFLPFPNGKYAGLFIEMKRPRGGYATEEQRDFQAYLNGVGYLSVIHNNWCDAAREIVAYLGLTPDQYEPIPTTWEIGELSDHERLLLGITDGFADPLSAGDEESA